LDTFLFYPQLENQYKLLQIDIYENDRKIETKNFESHFYIIKDELGLHWETGKEQYERTELVRNNKELIKNFRCGTFQIWIRANEIAFVLPDWQLTLDGKVMERGFYTDVNVSGKSVELKYSSYRFVCTFPP
jgi:hypothetical protein